MTSIEWTDETWNPVRGCSRVSAGCTNCYAERMAARNLPEMRRATGEPYALRTPGGPRWTGVVDLIPKKLAEPLHWREPRRVFVNSMSDLFHESLPDEAIDQVFAVMALAERHTFQILTKRPDRMRDYMRGRDWGNAVNWATDRFVRPLSGPLHLAGEIVPPLPNVWLGVSVEDQATADARVPRLLDTAAAKRFVSYEPALGPVDFNRRDLLCLDWSRGKLTIGIYLDWIIVGGESGPGARPFNLDWARQTVRQCRETETPCFVKQLGGHAHDITEDGRLLSLCRKPCGCGRIGSWHRSTALRDLKGGDMPEWPEDLRVREFPA